MQKEDLIIVRNLFDLFTSKDWFKNHNSSHVFEKFCGLIGNLTDKQQVLIYELTERYLWITSSEYEKKFAFLIDKFIKSLGTCKKIYLFPIIKPEHEKKVKSGHHCIYLFHSIIRYHHILKTIPYEIILNFSDISTINFKTDGSEQILLVDDFVGSGETLKATLAEVSKNKTILSDYLNIITLVIQEEVMKELNGTGVVTSFFYEQLLKKGISDHYPSPVVNEKIEVMKEIEKSVKEKHFNFGFNHSEGLVTMERTPDNTFPIFWSKYTVKGEIYEPPFPR
jgi:hypothetical protein